MSKLQAAFSQACGERLHLIGEGLATPERAEVVKSATNRCHLMTHGTAHHGSQDHQRLASEQSKQHPG
ncbi:MAG: hypothetical protein NWQ37_11965, partial [Marivita lacus]|nr:hypothetical protein [Marivita lacus]